ncbi:MAG: type I methionyl aminopeptidase [Dehalococcoidales bacterium]|nr:type I methionyl aminopeptidase [Dehalococcoidales bacterium]
MGITLKREPQLRYMREAGKITAKILDLLRKSTKSGISTKELDIIAERETKALGAKPAFKGYGGFPGSVCISINDEIVHGIPGKRTLQEGDIVSYDYGVIINGFYSDSAITVPVGEVSPLAHNLIKTTEESMMAGIAMARAGGRLGDISSAIQKYAESMGFSVIREYTGHGVGRDLHEDPMVPNFGVAGRGMELKNGLVIAIEPMLSAGSWKTKVGSDHWLVSTMDGSLSAHFEHTVCVRNGEAEILTKLDEK